MDAHTPQYLDRSVVALIFQPSLYVFDFWDEGSGVNGDGC